MSKALFLCPKTRGGDHLPFTKGKHKEYERLMQEKPGHDGKGQIGRRIQKDKTIQFATAENKDCPYCLYYDEKKKMCSIPNCIVFDE